MSPRRWSLANRADACSAHLAQPVPRRLAPGAAAYLRRRRRRSNQRSEPCFLPADHQPGTTPQVLASDGSGALDWEALPPVPFEVHLADYAGGTEPSGVPEIALSLTPARALLQRAEKSRIKRATLGLLGSVGPAHYGSPSDADSAIVTALIGAGFTSSEVLTLVLSSPRRQGTLSRGG